MLIVLKKPPLCLNELCPLLTELLNLNAKGLTGTGQFTFHLQVYIPKTMLTLYHITWEFTNAYCIEGPTGTPLPKQAVPAADHDETVESGHGGPGHGGPANGHGRPGHGVPVVVNLPGI